MSETSGSKLKSIAAASRSEQVANDQLRQRRAAAHEVLNATVFNAPSQPMKRWNGEYYSKFDRRTSDWLPSGTDGVEAQVIKDSYAVRGGFLNTVQYYESTGQLKIREVADSSEPELDGEVIAEWDGHGPLQPKTSRLTEEDVLDIIEAFPSED